MKRESFIIFYIIVLALAAGFFGVNAVWADHDNDDDDFWVFWERDERSRSDREHDDDRYEGDDDDATPIKYQNETNDAALGASTISTQEIVYQQDSDNDGLIDQYDKHPGVNDLLFVYDSDHDGISDAEDKYRGENDFAYLITDRNSNGIADELESMVGR